MERAVRLNQRRSSATSAIRAAEKAMGEELDRMCHTLHVPDGRKDDVTKYLQILVSTNAQKKHTASHRSSLMQFPSGNE